MRDFLWVMLISMVPVIELRGAIPVGAGLGLPALESYLAAVVGNMLPVPFIILFIRRVFAFIRRCWPWLNRLLDRIEKRAEKKIETVQKYEVLGLLLFVAIPLPGTGAWTGSLIAALLDVRLRRALPAIFAGVVIAGIVVSLVSYGVLFGIRTLA